MFTIKKRPVLPFIGGFCIGILISGSLLLFVSPRSRRNRPPVNIHQGGSELVARGVLNKNRNLKHDLSPQADSYRSHQRSRQWLNIDNQLADTRRLKSVPRFAHEELSLRKLLYIGMFMPSEAIDDWVPTIEKTWAQHTKHYDIFVSSHADIHGELQLVQLTDIKDAVSNGTKLFSMLKYMCHHYIDEYNWFVILPNHNTYIRYNAMETLFKQLNNSQILYIGPKHNNKPYCNTGAGVVLSRKALQQICPYLDECAGKDKIMKFDEVFGKCMTKYAEVNCTEAKQFQKLFDNLNEQEDVNGNLMDQSFLNNLLSMYPVRQRKDMYRLHLYYRNRTLQTVQKDLLSLISVVNNMDTLQQSFLSVVKETKDRLVYGLSKNKYVTLWKIVGDHIRLSSYKIDAKNHEARTVIEEAVKSLPDDIHWNKMTVTIYRKENIGDSLEYIVSIHGDGIYTITVKQPIDQLIALSAKTMPNVRLNIIVPLQEYDANFQQFMMNLEKSCLQNYQSCNISLLAVIFHEPQQSNLLGAKDLISLYQHKYPATNLRYIEVHGKTYSQTEALKIALSEFNFNSLLAILNTNTIFNSDFLDRCRLATIQHIQAYIPIPFQYFYGNSYYKSSSFNNSFGFWNYQNKDTLCVYRSDLHISAELKTFTGNSYMEKFSIPYSVRIFRVSDDGLALNDDCLLPSLSQKTKFCENSFAILMQNYFKIKYF